MAKNPLEKAIDNALTANAEIGKLFARIGNTNHPRGIVPTAYRNARRAMRSALKETRPVQSAAEVMNELKATVRAGMIEVLNASQENGYGYADRQLSIYDLPFTQPAHEEMRKQSLIATTAILSVIDQQSTVIRTMIDVGIDTDMILGDAERVGMLRVGDVISTATYWTTTLVWSAFSNAVSHTQARSRKADRIKKLAVAAIDSRTTDCCLRVHGQVQPFDKPFKLTGTPRFADELHWSPFHRYCRTSIALYYDEYDEGITDRMKGKARNYLVSHSKS